jgi:tripartite-type tricarboxylate transporter receptor subunit TctC
MPALRSLAAAVLLLLPAAFLPSVPAAAQSWPAKAIRLVVPFPAGGATDVVARLVAQKLGEALGQQVVIENRGGAGGTLGSDLVAKAPADGYTLLMSNIASHGVGPSLYKGLGYDSLRDFTHVAMLAQIPSVLIVNAQQQPRDLAGFVAWAKQNPGRVHIASPGNGSSSHIKQELLKKLAGIDTVHVPYRGSAPALNDVLANQVEGMITTVLEATGKEQIRILATTAAERVDIIPDVPTFKELGYPALVASTWFGLSAPAGLPEAIADRLNAEVVKALAMPEMAARLADFGVKPNRMSRGDFTGFIAAEVDRWAEVVRSSGARVE